MHVWVDTLLKATTVQTSHYRGWKKLQSFIVEVLDSLYAGLVIYCLTNISDHHARISKLEKIVKHIIVFYENDILNLIELPSNFKVNISMLQWNPMLLLSIKTEKISTYIICPLGLFLIHNIFIPGYITFFVLVDSSQEGSKINNVSVMKTSLDMESAAYISYLLNNMIYGR